MTKKDTNVYVTVKSPVKVTLHVISYNMLMFTALVLHCKLINCLVEGVIQYRNVVAKRVQLDTPTTSDSL